MKLSTMKLQRETAINIIRSAIFEMFVRSRSPETSDEMTARTPNFHESGDIAIKAAGIICNRFEQPLKIQLINDLGTDVMHIGISMRSTKQEAVK